MNEEKPETTEQTENKDIKPIESNLYFNQKQRPEHKKIVDSRLLRKIFFVLGLVTIILAIFVVIGFVINKNQNNNLNEQGIDKKIEVNNSENVPAENIKNVVKEDKEKNMNIYFIDGENEYEILTYNKLPSNNIVEYNGELYTYVNIHDPEGERSSYHGESNYYLIKKYDEDDNTFKTVLDTRDIVRDYVVTDINDERYNDWIGTVVSEFKIIDDLLILGLSDYRNTGFMVSVDLSKEAYEITLLSKNENRFTQITKFEDDFYIEDHHGDSCFALDEYKYLNLDTLEVSPLIKTEFNCGEGESFLDYKNGVFILFKYDKLEQEDNEIQIGDGFNEYVDSIISVDKNGNKQTLYDFPDDEYYHSPLYLEDLGVIYFIESDTLYKFDLDKTELIELNSYDTPKGDLVKIRDYHEDKNGLCIGFKGENKYNYYFLVDDQNGDIKEENEETCKNDLILMSNREIIDTEMERHDERISYFESLNLSDNYIYKFEIEPIEIVFNTMEEVEQPGETYSKNLEGESN